MDLAWIGLDSVSCTSSSREIDLHVFMFMSASPALSVLACYIVFL